MTPKAKEFDVEIFRLAGFGKSVPSTLFVPYTLRCQNWTALISDVIEDDTKHLEGDTVLVLYNDASKFAKEQHINVDGIKHLHVSIEDLNKMYTSPEDKCNNCINTLINRHTFKTHVNSCHGD